MTYEQTLTAISKYLSGEKPYDRIADVVQYTHFVRGVYVVQAKTGQRFSPKFLEWVDKNELYHVSLQSVDDGKNIYAIVVRNPAE